MSYNEIKNNMNRISFRCIAGAWLVLAAGPAWAYIDPGTGSMLVQSALAIIAVVAGGRKVRLVQGEELFLAAQGRCSRPRGLGPPWRAVQRHPASFRDPEARVFVAGGRVLRALTAEAAARYDAVRATGLLDALEKEGLVVASREAPDAPPAGFVRMLEHEALAFVSYPYEWPFALLKRAALAASRHPPARARAGRDAHRRERLQRAVSRAAGRYSSISRRFAPTAKASCGLRTGSSASNFSTRCSSPRNSASPTTRGIAARSKASPPPRSPRYGRRAGGCRRARWSMCSCPRPPSARRRNAQTPRCGKVRRARLPKAGYAALLGQLRRWIAGLEPRGFSATQWAGYAQARNYSAAALEAKRRVVAEFAARHRPATLWDLGCNDGEFTEVALANGAGAAIGFDADPGALELACARGRARTAAVPAACTRTRPTPARRRAGWDASAPRSPAEAGPTR